MCMQREIGISLGQGPKLLGFVPKQWGNRRDYRTALVNDHLRRLLVIRRNHARNEKSLKQRSNWSSKNIGL